MWYLILLLPTFLIVIPHWRTLRNMHLVVPLARVPYANKGRAMTHTFASPNPPQIRSTLEGSLHLPLHKRLQNQTNQ